MPLKIDNVKVKLKEGAEPVKMTVHDLARWIVQHSQEKMLEDWALTLAHKVLEQENELIRLRNRELPVYNAN